MTYVIKAWDRAGSEVRRTVEDNAPSALEEISRLLDNRKMARINVELRP